MSFHILFNQLKNTHRERLISRVFDDVKKKRDLVIYVGANGKVQNDVTSSNADVVYTRHRNGEYMHRSSGRALELKRA